MYGDGYGRGGGNSYGDAPVAPVRVGEEVDVRIEAVGEKGDGIARKKGFVLFIPNTQEGQEVRIRITKVLRKVGFAEVIGEAQAPIESDNNAPPRREEAPAIQPEPAEPSPEDSEDFGEEPSEEPVEDTPVDESSDKESDSEMDVPPAPETSDEEKTE